MSTGKLYLFYLLKPRDARVPSHQSPTPALSAELQNHLLPTGDRCQLMDTQHRRDHSVLVGVRPLTDSVIPAM